MNVKPLIPVLLAVSLSACAQSAPTVVQSPVPVPLPATGQGLTPQIMFQLLLGEIASQRGDLKLAAEAYGDLAGRTRDARVAQRATELALYARQPQMALRAARQWREFDPSSAKAAQTLASLLVSAGRAAEARPHLAFWLKSGNEAELFMQLHGLFARQKDKQAALDLVEELAAGHPALPEARLAVAQMAWAAGNDGRALAALEQAMALRPGWQPAALLRAQVLARAPGEAAAMAYLDQFLAEYPDATEVRLAYARQLARAERLTEARAQFDLLRAAQPENPEHHFAIGLVALQMRDFGTAEQRLRDALALRHPDAGSVRFYLGQLAEADARLEDALDWYRQVDGGRQQLDATLRAALVLAKLGRVDEARAMLRDVMPTGDAEFIRVVQTEAMILRETNDFQGVFDVLSDALQARPDTPELLYDRAMAAEKLNRLDELERDLRRLIEVKPDYAHAYNALGYTLADRTDRIAEALELLEQALRLAPDDPFILDSMGWALFKAGRVTEAIDYLRRAFAGRPDPEIAAHLGEALWHHGERDEARRIWQGSMREHPDNEVLRETTSRLMR
jgi:tetratricopeptide (TPR) repeat protein